MTTAQGASDQRVLLPAHKTPLAEESPPVMLKLPPISGGGAPGMAGVPPKQPLALRVRSDPLPRPESAPAVTPKGWLLGVTALLPENRCRSKSALKFVTGIPDRLAMWS